LHKTNHIASTKLSTAFARNRNGNGTHLYYVRQISLHWPI